MFFDCRQRPSAPSPRASRSSMFDSQFSLPVAIRATPSALSKPQQRHAKTQRTHRARSKPRQRFDFLISAPPRAPFLTKRTHRSSASSFQVLNSSRLPSPSAQRHIKELQIIYSLHVSRFTFQSTDLAPPSQLNTISHP